VTLDLTCDQCGLRFQTDEQMAGATLVCPKCQHPLSLPAIEAEPDVDSRLVDLIGELQAREELALAPEGSTLADTPADTPAESPDKSRWTGIAPDGGPRDPLASRHPASPEVELSETAPSVNLEPIAPDTLAEITPSAPERTPPPLNLSLLARRNLAPLIVFAATLACWLLSNAQARYLPGGRSIEVGRLAVTLTTVGALLLVYGALVCNLRSPILDKLDSHMGKILIALATIWIAVVCVGNVRNAETAMRLDGQAVIVVAELIGWSVFGLFTWVLCNKFGSFRVLAAQFVVLAVLFVLMTLSLSREPPPQEVIAAMQLVVWTGWARQPKQR
jgi:hypothetical protein